MRFESGGASVRWEAGPSGKDRTYDPVPRPGPARCDSTPTRVFPGAAWLPSPRFDCFESGLGIVGGELGSTLGPE